MRNLMLLQSSINTSWLLKDVDGDPDKHILGDKTKKVALNLAIKYAKKNGTFENPISLKITGKNGKIKEERTYPKAKDPKKSKG